MATSLIQRPLRSDDGSEVALRADEISRKLEEEPGTRLYEVIMERIHTTRQDIHVMPWQIEPENGMQQPCILVATMSGNEMLTVSLHVATAPPVASQLPLSFGLGIQTDPETNAT